MNSVERVKQLCKGKKIPISKLEKDLGYSNGYISQLRKGVFPSNRLADIADYLGVSTDFIMTGNEEIEKKETKLRQKDERDIEKKLLDTLEQLESADGLMFNGEVLDDETKRLLEISLRSTLESAKIAAKKFTPKKYRD